MSKKKLTKSSTDKVWAGVLGGISEYFGLDSTWVRIGYIVLTVFSKGFPGLLLYILLAMIIPKSTDATRTRTKSNQESYSSFWTQNSSNKGRRMKEAEPVEDEDWSDF